MLANHVGVDAFLKGVSVYLRANLYGNSVTHDLWKGIEDATGMIYIRFLLMNLSNPLN